MAAAKMQVTMIVRLLRPKPSPMKIRMSKARIIREARIIVKINVPANEKPKNDGSVKGKVGFSP